MLMRCIAMALLVAAVDGPALSQGYPEPSGSAAVRIMACSNWGSATCDRLVTSLCGRNPTTACQRRHQPEFIRAQTFDHGH